MTITPLEKDSKTITNSTGAVAQPLLVEKDSTKNPNDKAHDTYGPWIQVSNRRNKKHMTIGDNGGRSAGKQKELTTTQ